MKATQQLKDEHEGIKLMLRIMESISTSLQKGDPLNADQYEKIIAFIKGFADKCHHGKEEDILFPALIGHGIQNEGGPVGVMLKEHQEGRSYIKELSGALAEFKRGNKGMITNIIKYSMDYVHLLRAHIEKENNILFMMADRVLDESEQSEIAEAFEKLEIEKTGIGEHEEYHRLLKELGNIYLK